MEIGHRPGEKEDCQVSGRSRVALIVRFIYVTRARVSEATYGRRDECKVGGERVSVRLHGKGQQDRIVRIPTALLQEIDRVFGRQASEWHR